jgi:hypothetical protein
MTESLKSVRFLNNLLVLVCAAIIVFAFTPDLARRYSDAEHELGQYSQLSMADYVQYLYSLPSFKRDEQEENAHVIELLRQNGYTVAEGVSFVAPLWASPINIGGSLGTFCRLVERKQTAVMPHVTPGTLVPLNTVSNAAYRHDSGDIVTAVVLGPPPNSNLESYVQTLGAEPTNFPTTSFLTLSILKQDGQQVQMTLQVTYISGSIERGYLGMNWLESTSHSSGLLGSNRCLPYSLQTFPEISRMQIADAMRYLASKSEAERKNDLEISSLRIDSATVGWTAPIILGLLLIFFISQVRHLRSVLRESASSKDYPWVGLFNDWLGGVIAYATIVVLPVLAESLLAIRVVAVSKTFRFSAPILVGMLSIWAGWELHRVRRAMRVHNEPLIDC